MICFTLIEKPIETLEEKKQKRKEKNIADRKYNNEL